MSDEARRARAAERRKRADSYPIRRYRIDDEPLLDQRVDTTVAERVEEVLRLSIEAFRASGQPWPSYARGEMPGRVIRG
jgi:hypothetical protein